MAFGGNALPVAAAAALSLALSGCGPIGGCESRMLEECAVWGGDEEYVRGKCGDFSTNVRWVYQEDDTILAIVDCVNGGFCRAAAGSVGGTARLDPRSCNVGEPYESSQLGVFLKLGSFCPDSAKCACEGLFNMEEDWAQICMDQKQTCSGTSLQGCAIKGENGESIEGECGDFTSVRFEYQEDDTILAKVDCINGGFCRDATNAVTGTSAVAPNSCSFGPGYEANQLGVYLKLADDSNACPVSSACACEELIRPRDANSTEFAWVQTCLDQRGREGPGPTKQPAGVASMVV